MVQLAETLAAAAAHPQNMKRNNMDERERELVPLIGTSSNAGSRETRAAAAASNEARRERRKCNAMLFCRCNSEVN